MKRSAFEGDNYFSNGSEIRVDVLYGWNHATPEHSVRLMGVAEPKEKESVGLFIGGMLRNTAIFMGIFYFIFKYWPQILEYLPYFLDGLQL